jgi:hypothetical protein
VNSGSKERRTDVSEDEAREDRRKDRQAWPIRRYNLGEEPSDNVRALTTASERLAMMWPLTRLSWRLAGRDMPRYRRSDMPGKILRSGAPD